MAKHKLLAAGTVLAYSVFTCHATPPLIVSTTADSGAGSLRQAILDANAASGPSTIDFIIPAGGVQTITSSSTPLPAVTSQVTIDGTTESGYAGSPLIVLNGNGTGLVDGLTISASGCVIKGLVFGKFGQSSNRPRAALRLFSDNNTVTACNIGVSETGLAGLFNFNTGILIQDGSGNVIGGLNSADRNLIGFNSTGIVITGANAKNNLVEGNWFSVGSDGTTSIVNGTDINITGGANNNTIGGNTAAARNVLDGVTQGIVVNGGAANNTISGNFVNIRPNGTATANPSGLTGVLVQGATGTLIGGNIISGCNIAIKIPDATTSGTTIQGNFLGTDGTGLAADFNFNSIAITGSSGNTIGGTTPGAGNVIIGKGIAAFSLSEGADNNIVQGNFIGTDATGQHSLALNNGSQTIGLLISSLNTATTGNLIGGTVPGARNVISGLSGDGIQMNGALVSDNQVEGNYIGVAADGVTPLGNAIDGVDVFDGNGNLVSGNTIAYNSSAGTAGVLLNAGSGNQVIGNFIFNNVVAGITELAPNIISQNSIFDNGGLGISYGGSSSETVNNPGQFHHFPVLTTATSSPTSTHVIGSLSGDAPGSQFIEEFFGNPHPDPSGFGEGKYFLGSAIVNTDANGNAPFDTIFPIPLPPGYTVSATSTSVGAQAESSVFGPGHLLVTDPLNPWVPTLTPGSLDANGLTVTWPSVPNQFILQQTDNPFPGANWQDVTPAPPPPVADRNVFIVKLTGTKSFFRLIQRP